MTSKKPQSGKAKPGSDASDTIDDKLDSQLGDYWQSKVGGDDIEEEREVVKSTAHVSVTAKPDESVESLLRRFNRAVLKSGLIDKMKELEYYEKPSERRKREKKLRAQTLKRVLRGG